MHPRRQDTTMSLSGLNHGHELRPVMCCHLADCAEGESVLLVYDTRNIPLMSSVRAAKHIHVNKSLNSLLRPATQHLSSIVLSGSYFYLQHIIPLSTNCVHLDTTKIDEFVCPPTISQTVAVRIMKLAHRQRIASTTIKLI